MKLAPYIETLRKNLEAAAAPGGKEVSDAAALLALAIESSARLSLIEALADASEEITGALHDTTVETRLRGREIEFVVSEADHLPIAPPPSEVDETDGALDGKVARISLRLPESLKESVERAASAENTSVNSWLVQAIAAAVDGGGSHGFRPGSPPGRPRFGGRFTGYARS